MLTALLCVTVFVFYACKKDDRQANKFQNLIEAAKEYFMSEVQQKKQKGIEANQFSFQLETDWKNADVEKLQSFEVVIVPLKFKQTIAISKDGGKTIRPLHVRPFLSIFKDKKGEMRAEVVYKFLDENTAGKAFSGNILVTDWAGNVNRGYRYKDGKAWKLDVSIGYKSNKPRTEGVCITTEYWQEVYREGQLIGTEYLGSTTVCTRDTEFQGDSGGNSGGGEPDYSGGGGGVSSGDTPGVAVSDVIDLLETPCFKATLSDMQGASSNDFVTNILNKMFSTSEKMDLIFQEGVLDPSEDGKTTSSNSGSFLKEYITLNSGVLKEYIAATLAHEIIHGYFNVRGIDPTVDQNFVQHQEMAGYYVDEMATMLV